MICVTLVPGNSQYGPWSRRTSAEQTDPGELVEVWMGTNGWKHWAEEMVCGSMPVCMDSRDLVVKFWDGVIRRTMC